MLDPMQKVEIGYCACGCGFKTKLSKTTDKRYSLVKGEPIKWFRGHQRHGYALTQECYVDEASGCWLWLGAKSARSKRQLASTPHWKLVEYARYGNAWRKLNPGRSAYAHVVYYEDFVGEIEDGMQIDHLCRNTSCVNPEHLEAVTPKENVRRAVPYRPKSRTKTNHAALAKGA